MLGRLSHDYETIKQFLKIIDSEFIDSMNHHCKNMKKYLSCEFKIEEIQQNILSRRTNKPGY